MHSVFGKDPVLRAFMIIFLRRRQYFNSLTKLVWNVGVSFIMEKDRKG